MDLSELTWEAPDGRTFTFGDRPPVIARMWAWSERLPGVRAEHWAWKFDRLGFRIRLAMSESEAPRREAKFARNRAP